MSDELILDVSFDNQTVTDATENWTLSGTPNVTYEQISGGSGYSLVTGKLGTPPTLVAVDQEAIYNEYTIDFNLYVKPSYTDTGWFSFFSLYAGMNYSGDYRARVYNGLTISIEIGASRAEVTIDSPTGRWIHITIISEYDSNTGAYTAYLYVDSVLRTYKQGTRLNGSPFVIGKKLVLFNRGNSSFFLPNTPGLAMDNLTVIAGIHVPNQTPAISLPNLSRVFQNFCTWISSQLSAVAKSGSYNDLSDKPTISTVNDGTLTIQKNGTDVATFSANSSTNATANITVPTKTSDLTNDSGFITSDNTKIPLAGSNQISGSLIPATTDAYDLGGPSYQWNNAYIKSLTINGVACGDILTHNVSEFVDVSTAQTIAGVKTFSNIIYTSGQQIIIKNNNVERTVLPASTVYMAFAFSDKNSVGVASRFSAVENVIKTNGDINLDLIAYDFSTKSNTRTTVVLERKYDGTNNFYPEQNNTVNLGTSTNKWKSFNGINPGALSLLSSTYINVDTTNWDLTCQNELMGSFTPTADGWLMLHVANSGTSEVNFWIIGGVLRINNKSTLSTSDNNNFNMITIPVTKGTTYNIYGNASEYVAGRRIAYCRFTPCQGNV